MPKMVKNAKILILNAALEYKKTEVNAKINITRPDQVQAFLDEDEQMVHTMADKIVKSGATVVFCQKGIDDLAQHYLTKAGIFAVRRVKKSDCENIARATGATIVNSIDAITPCDLGDCRPCGGEELSGKEMIYVSGCKNPKAVSIIIRGSSEHVIDELERGMHDALMVVGEVVKNKKIVAGGGAPETELSLQLRRYASSVGGRIQLAIEAFAAALEIIPRSIAENAGLDPIDMIVAIRAAHEAGNRTFGLDVYQGKPVDMLKGGIVEPLRVKTQAIMSAAEAAVMILRIDDVIASSKAPGLPAVCHRAGCPREWVTTRYAETGYGTQKWPKYRMTVQVKFIQSGYIPCRRVQILGSRQNLPVPDHPPAHHLRTGGHDTGKPRRRPRTCLHGETASMSYRQSSPISGC